MLQGISDSIILNDLAARANIRDVETLKALVSFLTDNIGQLVNLTKIANTLKSEGINTNVHTLQNYLTALENAFLFYRVRQYNINYKKTLITQQFYPDIKMIDGVEVVNVMDWLLEN